MSEFKFACPVCGQHITADSSASGSQLDCPTCFRKIVVPSAPTSTESKFILSAAQATKRRPPQAEAAAQPASAPAAPPSRVIPAALILLVLLGAAGATLFVFRGKILKPAGEALVTTNLPPPVPKPSAPPRAPDGPPPGLAVIAPGSNLALNKRAFASSQEARNPMQSGNDGNDGTRWCAANGNVPQWWTVDLGSSASVTNTRVLWEHNAVYRYKLDLSPDNKNWVTVADHTTNAVPGQFSSDTFAAPGRYVRITVTGLQAGSWASFFEFQALGTVGTNGANRHHDNGHGGSGYPP